MGFPHSLLRGSGVSRAELIIVVLLVLVVGALAYWSFSRYFAKASINRAVTCAHTIDTVLSQYATDNDGVYPVGLGTQAVGKSEGIALDLLQNNYVPDASVFAVGSTPKYAGRATDFSDLSSANVSWDFTAGTTPMTGITSSAPELLPIVFTTGETVAYPKTTGSGFSVVLSGNGPFGMRGMVAGYKSGNAKYIPASTGSGKASCPDFISTAFGDPASYTQIRP